jgi:hypothetical protein
MVTAALMAVEAVTDSNQSVGVCTAKLPLTGMRSDALAGKLDSCTFLNELSDALPNR